MKVRTKSGLLTVLLAVVFALTLCAGLWLAMPKSSNNVSAEAETGLVPLYGDELAQNPSYHAHDQGGGSAVFWDAAPTQMRIHFKYVGDSAPTRPGTGGQLGKCVTELGKYILLTKDGVTKSVVEWAWGWYAPATVNDNGSYEIWICAGSENLNAISQITILAGLTWQDVTPVGDGYTATPVADAVVHKNYVIKFNEDKTNYELVSDTEPVGLVPLYGEGQTKSRVADIPSHDTTAYWGKNGLRLFFRMSGVNAFPAQEHSGGVAAERGGYFGNTGTNVSITAGGDTKTIAQWKTENKIAWAAPANGHGLDGTSVYELWINCGEGEPAETWCASITSVTLTHGLQWSTQNGPVAGAVLDRDYTLNLDEDHVWQLGSAGDPVKPDEKSITPLGVDEITGHFANSDKQTAPKVFWDASPSQMRFYFKLNGIAAPNDSKGQNIYNGEENILLTTKEGETHPIKDWATVMGGYWLDNSRVGPNDDTYHEIWLWTQNQDWFNSLGYVTIKAGFRLKANASTPIDGAVVKETVYLKINENGQYEKCTEQDIPKQPQQEVEFTPLTAAEAKGHFKASGDGNAAYTGKFGSYWGITQMRFYFKATGLNLTGANPGTGVYNQSDKILLTDANNDTKSVKEWGLDKIAWIDFWVTANSGVTEIGYGEIDFCIAQGTGQPGDHLYDTNTVWLAGIKKVTFKAGFEWLTAANTPLEGATLKEDVVLWNGGIEAGWQKYADSITATLTGGDIPQGANLEDYLTVKAKYGTEEEAVTGYTLEGYDNTKGGVAQTVTVKYQDKETTVSVTLKAPDKTLTDIELSGTTTFTVKRFEQLTITGLIVKAKFSDGSATTLTDTDYKIAPFDTYQAEGDYTLKVSYKYAAKTCEKNITVKIDKPDTTTGLEFAWKATGTRWHNKPAEDPAYATDITMLRLHFKNKEGAALPLVEIKTNEGVTAMNAASHLLNYILLNGEDSSKWADKISWIAPHSAIQTLNPDIGGLELILAVKEGADRDANMKWLAGIKTVTLKAGLTWFDINGDVADAILKEDVELWDEGEQGWTKHAQRLEVSTTQKNPPIGATVDCSKITAKVFYLDSKEGEEITVNPEMLDVTTFTEGGTQIVTITYQDVTAQLTFQVSDEKITGIKVTQEPTKKLYRFGTLALDTRGIQVVKLFEGEEADPKNAIDINDLTFEGYDPYCMEEKQIITVRYGNFTTTFEIKMEPLENGIEIDWGMSSFDTQINVEGLTVVILSPAEKELNPVKVPFDAPGVIDKLKINGKPAQEYVDKGVIDWVGFYTWRFVIALNTPDLVWGTESDGSHSAGKSYYVEGRSELIRTVELLPGFQVYTTRDGADHWDEAASMKYARAVEGSALTHNVLLYNADGHGWDRVLKQGAGANLDGSSADFKLVPAEDAITLKSSGKVTYKKGENISVRGFVFTLQFEDGGTEDRALSPIQIDTDTYDPDTLGEQNVKIEISGGVYYLKVTVTEDGQGGEQPGDQPGGEQPGEQGGEEEGGCGGILGINALMLMCGGCALALLRRRKK